MTLEQARDSFRRHNTPGRSHTTVATEAEGVPQRLRGRGVVAAQR